MARKRSSKRKAITSPVIQTPTVVKVECDSTKKAAKRTSVATERKPTKSRTPSIASFDSPIRKKKRKVSAEAKISQKEKIAFLQCLQQSGFSCLNNEDILAKTFPNRSMPEIRVMIDNYSRKAQELNRKNEATISGGHSDECKQPIEKWYDLLHSLVPSTSKKDDISSIFVDFFDEYSIDETPIIGSELDEETEQNLRPNYRVIYDTIRDILNGKYAKQLEPINAFFILKLIEELKQFIKSDNNRKEMSFLKSGLWWQMPNMTNAQKSNDNIIRAISAIRQQQNGEQSSQDNHLPSQLVNGNEEFIGNDILTTDLMEQNEDEFEMLRNFPKLRKIIECLNPLRVPTEMTANEVMRWQQM